jgi:hypothetical protein
MKRQLDIQEIDTLTKELKGEDVRIYQFPPGDRRTAAEIVLSQAWTYLLQSEANSEKGRDISKTIEHIRFLLSRLKKL